MAENFDGLQIAADSAHPTWFKSFLTIFNRLVAALQRNTQSKVYFKDTIRYLQTIQPARNGISLTLRHDLDSPAGVCLVAGRVATYSFSIASKTSVTVLVTLPSSSLVSPPIGVSTSVVTIAEPDKFRIGDIVSFGKQTRIIQSIQGSRVTLNKALAFTDTYSMALFETKVTITYF
jgi:hypothetical protein